MVVVVSEAAWTKVWDAASGVAYFVVEIGDVAGYQVQRPLGNGTRQAMRDFPSYTEAVKYARRRVQRTLQARRHCFRQAVAKAQS
jgi:hypothetical protein